MTNPATRYRNIKLEPQTMPDMVAIHWEQVDDGAVPRISPHRLIADIHELTNGRLLPKAIGYNPGMLPLEVALKAVALAASQRLDIDNIVGDKDEDKRDNFLHSRARTTMIACAACKSRHPKESLCQYHPMSGSIFDTLQHVRSNRDKLPKEYKIAEAVATASADLDRPTYWSPGMKAHGWVVDAIAAALLLRDLQQTDFEEALESAYWRMDHLHKKGAGAGPCSERDAYKMSVRGLIAEDRLKRPTGKDLAPLKRAFDAIPDNAVTPKEVTVWVQPLVNEVHELVGEPDTFIHDLTATPEQKRERTGNPEGLRARQHRAGVAEVIIEAAPEPGRYRYIDVKIDDVVGPGMWCEISWTHCIIKDGKEQQTNYAKAGTLESVLCGIFAAGCDGIPYPVAMRAIALAHRLTK